MIDYQTRQERINDKYVVDRFTPAPIFKRVAKLSLVLGSVFLICAFAGAEFWAS